MNMKRTAQEWAEYYSRQCVDEGEFDLCPVIQQAMDQARNEALEEAAKECAALDDDGGRIAGMKMAIRIRALKKP